MKFDSERWKKLAGIITECSCDVQDEKLFKYNERDTKEEKIDDEYPDDLADFVNPVKSSQNLGDEQ